MSQIIRLVEGAEALLRCSGAYTLSKVYVGGNDLYVKKGSSYLKLLSKSKTSKSNVFVVEIVGNLPIDPDNHYKR